MARNISNDHSTGKSLRPKGEYSLAWSTLTIISEETPASPTEPAIPARTSSTKKTSLSMLKPGSSIKDQARENESISVGSILGEIYAYEVELESGWRELNGEYAVI